MDIKMLPDKCPKCNNTIFKQKIPIHGFADKLYSMVLMKEVLDHPVMVVETNPENSDYNNDIVCNACGEVIVTAEANKCQITE